MPVMQRTERHAGFLCSLSYGLAIAVDASYYVQFFFFYLFQSIFQSNAVQPGFCGFLDAGSGRIRQEIAAVCFVSIQSVVIDSLIMDIRFTEVALFVLAMAVGFVDFFGDKNVFLSIKYKIFHDELLYLENICSS